MPCHQAHKNHLFYRTFRLFPSATSPKTKILSMFMFRFGPYFDARSVIFTLLYHKIDPCQAKSSKIAKSTVFPVVFATFCPQNGSIFRPQSVLLNLVKYQISSCFTEIGRSLCLSRYTLEQTVDFFSGPMYKNCCPLVRGAIPRTCKPFLSIESIVYLPRSVK